MSSPEAMTEAGPRERLLDAALRLLEERGPEALQARKLTAEIGASTMAVYTHFGGLPGLIEEVVRQGFTRFGHCLAQAPKTEDPVADLMVQGLAYRDFALGNPQLYRLMFGLTTRGMRGGSGHDLTPGQAPAGLAEGTAAFSQLVTAVVRIVEAGRIREIEPVHAAAQLWSVVHGYVLLEITGYFGSENHGVDQVLGPLTMNVLIGLGDTEDALARSAQAARSTRVSDA